MTCMACPGPDRGLCAEPRVDDGLTLRDGCLTGSTDDRQWKGAQCQSSAPTTPASSRRLPARLPRYLRHGGHRRGRSRDPRSRRPRPSVHARRRCAPRCRAMPSAPTTPSACCIRCAGSARRAAAASSRVSWDEALDEIAARLPIAAPDGGPRGDPAVQLCRHDGPAAGRQHGPALLQPARRVAARPHHLRVGRRRGARRDLRREGRHARRALCREPVDRDLGQQLDHVEPALLDPRAAGEAGRREADLHRSAPHRDGREDATSTSRCCRAPTARSRSAVMHELIANDWLDHDYIDRHVDGWPALRERALQWPPERAAEDVRHRGRRRCARWRATTARSSRRRSASTTACSACAAAATRCA